MATVSAPRTIKVVIIGESGTGKTSFRNQYITGRFSSAYRATIGADFITKKLEHPAHPGSSVMLQIWDTAGQERFSALSAAFFRGADAAVLMFDVTRPDSLASLRRWWEEFATKCPVPRETETEFCAVFVGNKTDLASRHGSSNGMVDGYATSGGHDTVTEQVVHQFIQDLIPTPTSPTVPPEHLRTITIEGALTDSGPEDDDSVVGPTRIPFLNGSTRPRPAPSSTSDTEREPESPPRSPSRSRSIGVPPGNSPRPPWASRTRQQASSRREANGTTTTGHSIYHTPAASLFRATSPSKGRPSPKAASSIMSMETARSQFSASTPTPRSRLLSHSSVDSGATVKPSHAPDPVVLPQVEETPTQDRDVTQPEVGPKVFWTSARTGDGVAPVFAYIAKRVVQRWEWEESRLDFDEGAEEGDGPTALRLRDDWGKGKIGWRAACC